MSSIIFVEARRCKHGVCCTMFYWSMSSNSPFANSLNILSGVEMIIRQCKVEKIEKILQMAQNEKGCECWSTFLMNDNSKCGNSSYRIQKGNFTPVHEK